MLRQSAQDARRSVVDLLSVRGSGLARERALRNTAGGKREFDEHAHLAFNARTIVERARHGARLLIRRRRERRRGQEDAQQLLTALLGEDPALLPLKRLILEKTEGNPFFMEEIVQELVEQGVLVRDAVGGSVTVQVVSNPPRVL